MNIKDSFFYTIKPESLKKTWEEFSKIINGEFKFKENIRANVNGPIYVYSISGKIEDFDLKIEQTVYINPGSNDQPTPLTYILSRVTRQKIFLRIWERDLIEKIFGLNKTNSGNEKIDKKFSLKTNHIRLRQLIETNENIIKVLTSSKSHFHIETKNNTLEIVYKHSGISESNEDFLRDLEVLKLIIKEITSL
ncbi:hypothetical protein INQ51_11085 [Maribellus sp. CM-23]|uniref:hypothetical protein n=1 Tax=Maribellus sp. CM-23 TaxID=2781026 RepID=UPI001F1C61AC|nr:hypothetical protein [Maribellus sp. CM-23]MCE4564852.1 hypothetical protein [Maribellus sp. CM-23]